ncbi:MAG: protein kinase [Planctomycetota bacterium]|nr:protein kinase [Planctomycetota bacterium]
MTEIFCATCKLRYKLANYQPGKVYRCKKCGQPLTLDDTEATLIDLTQGGPRVPQTGSRPPAAKTRRPAAEPAPLPPTSELELADRGLGESHIPTEIPVRLGRYMIDSEIGRGAMGVIYKGRQEKLDRWVAIKMLLPGALSSPEMVKRFQREARSAARLKHPNIVTIHEVGESEGKPFFTMDFIDGISLEKMMDTGRLAPQVILPLVRDVAEAVDYANKNGIIHRDLKPANILIDGEGKPKITDFGLAKDISSASVLSVSGEIMGTPDYMSPEQAGGRVHEIDGRTDVFALGAIMYDALTGMPPHHGATLTDTLMQILNSDVMPPERVNKSLDTDLSSVVMKALEKDKKLRYDSAGELAADIGRYLAGEPVKARPISLMRRLRKKMAKNRVTAAAALAAVVVLVLAILIAPALLRKSYLTFAKTELASGNPAVRANTLKALADKLLQTEEIEPEELESAVELIIGRLTDEDESVRDVALDFLERCAHLAGKGIVTGKEFPASPLEPARLERIVTLALSDSVEPVAGMLAKAKVFENVTPAARTLTVRLLVIASATGHLDCVPPILRVLDSPVDEVRLNAVRALAYLPDRRALSALLRIHLNDDVCRTDAKIALDNLYAYSMISPYSAHDDALKQNLAAMTDAISQYNQQMQDMLDEMGDESGNRRPKKAPLQATFDALKSANVEDRLRAIYELRQVCNQKDVHPAVLVSIMTPLVEALADGDSDVGRAAAQALSDAVPRIAIEQNAGSLPATIKPIDDIAAALGSSQPNGRANAALALSFLKSGESVDPLIIALQKEQAPEVKAALAEALGRLRDKRALPYLLEQLKDTDAAVREKAAKALNMITGANHGMDYEKWKTAVEEGN